MSEMEKEFLFRNANLPQCCFKRFSSMRNQDKFCDVKFTVGTQCITAHRVILAAAIPLFQDTISEEEEFLIKDMEPTIFGYLIDYVYSGELKITMENVKVLLSMADILRMKDVQDACCDFLCQRLSTENVLRFRKLAVDLNLTQLKDFTDLYFKEHFEEVSKTDEFLHTPFTDLTELIGKDDLNVSSEEEILESVLKWVKASVMERKDELPKLLQQVRMVLLKPLFLKDLVEREELIRTSLLARDLVDEASNYNLFPNRRKAVCSFCTESRQFVKIYNQSEETDSTIYSLNVAMKCTVFRLDPVKEKWSSRLTKEYWVCSSSVGALNRMMYFFDGVYAFRYDPARNEITFFTNMAVPRKRVAAVSLGNKIFVCGGYVTRFEASNDVECFDPRKSQWTQVNPLMTARFSPNALSLGDYVYVLGGRNKNIIFDTVERYYSSTEKWQYVASMLTSRSDFASAVLNGKIYVCGGYISTDEDKSTATAEVFDPVTNKWNFISSMNAERSELRLTAFRGLLYTVGGNVSHGEIPKSCEIYDPVTNKWALGPSFGMHHNSSAAVVI